VQAVARKLTSRGEERRRQLIEFATERFASNGYHPTSVADIVRGVGVGKGVFYWYFDSKEALFRAILRNAQGELRRYQADAIADAGDPLDRLARGIEASIRWSTHNSRLAKLVEFAATDDRFADAIRKGREVAISDTMQHIKDAIADGLIPDGDPVLLTHATFGVVNELNRHVLTGPQEPTEADLHAAVGFCLGGLLGAAPR
jgi:AcrR family transcriptional regulator